MILTIYQWRKVKDISQKKLAIIMGVHENTIRNWERHPEKLTIEKAEKIADALNVPIDSIIFLSSIPQNVELKK
jgi:transcriptional regulator with XRE-family HTH domain